MGTAQTLTHERVLPIHGQQQRHSHKKERQSPKKQSLSQSEPLALATDVQEILAGQTRMLNYTKEMPPAKSRGGEMRPHAAVSSSKQWERSGKNRD